MRVWIGYDDSEINAYLAAANSLQQHSTVAFSTLQTENLRSCGLYWRNVDKRGTQPYDLISNAPCSTDFATTRFLTPLLNQEGWALFVDSDVIFLECPSKILHELPNKNAAVYVVKHQHTGGGTKMGGLAQTSYGRKNWSSVMLFNCNHPANRRLTLWDINNRPGRDLHQFYWLHNSEIGELPARWNWLVNVQPQPKNCALAHFTQGGPWIRGWKPAPHDDLWQQYGS